MQKILFYGAAGILLVSAGIVFLLGGFNKASAPAPTGAASYKDATYLIDGKEVTLVNGTAETEIAPGSASKLVTTFFGNELATDLNGDGRPDEVFLLTQSGGGSGTFYYVVAALNTDHGYVGSDGYLLGDRIAPQTTEVSQNPKQKGVIVVNYADRAVDEPMTAQPSIGKSVYLKLDPVSMRWGIVEPNFAGESDPARMTLDMKTWQWVGADYNDGSSLTLHKPAAFTLTFLPDNRFSATTDCNALSGAYTASSSDLTFSNIASTRMYCADSQETDFSTLLEHVSSYHFTGKGELIFDLKADSGSAVFK